MSQDVAPFVWRGNSERAVELVAQDRLTNEEIALEIGVARRTIDRWKTHPEFAARVRQAVADANAKLRGEGIVHKQNRIDLAEQRHALMRRAVELRAERVAARLDPDPAVAAAQAAREVFGGKVPLEATTGIFAEKETVNAGGQRSVEWAFDAALFREMREHEKQVAQEKGEWTEKREDKLSADEAFLAALRDFGRS